MKKHHFFLTLLLVLIIPLMTDATTMTEPDDRESHQKSFIELIDSISPEQLGVQEGLPSDNIPSEIKEAFSKPQESSLPLSILNAKSQELREKLSKNPNDPYIMHELGTVMFHLDGEKEALALWSAAHNKDANLAPADLLKNVHKLLSYINKKEIEKAKELLPDLEAKYEKEAHYQLILAEQAMRGRNFKEAGRSYHRAYELRPDLYVTALNLGRFQEFMGTNSDQIMKLYQAAVKLGPHQATTWIHLGNFQASLSQDKEAIKSFAKAKQIFSSGPSPEKRLGDFYFRSMQYNLSEKWYKKALDKQLEDDEEAKIHETLGDLYLRQNQLDKARYSIEKALRYKEKPQLVFALGTINDSEGKTSEAEKNYRRVLELSQGNPLALNNLAMLLIKMDRSVNEALRLSAQARENIPNNLIIESTYGCALSLCEKHSEAIVVLGRVLASKANDSWARYCLGRSLIKSERKDEGIAILNRLIKDDPLFEKHQNALFLIENSQQ